MGWREGQDSRGRGPEQYPEWRTGQRDENLGMASLSGWQVTCVLIGSFSEVDGGRAVEKRSQL